MRILLLTQLFQPEPNHLKGLAFARELVRQGHEVEVLTGFPNYPGGRIYPGYRQRFYQRELLDGIPIVRVPLFPDHSRSVLRRILCYLSLTFTACVPGLFLIRRPDVVHVYLGPATLALPAMLLRLLRRVPYVLDVQDLWPESVTSSGMLRGSRLVQPLLHAWCRLSYRLAAKIVVLSPGYKRVLCERGVAAGKIEVVYNWCDEQPPHGSPSAVKACDDFGLSDCFSVVYAGNFGRVQALDAVLEAAALLQEAYPVVRFVFVGDGVEEERLKEQTERKGLTNVRFIPRQPSAQIGALLAQAQALLIHLRDDPLCRIGIPQKTQAYLAAGRPIIMAVRGDAATLVADAQAGIPCEPESPESIAAAVMKLYGLTERERADMGRNGQAYYQRQLAFSVGTRKMNAILTGVDR